LGGVEIPYEKGLLGHSDADALLHAVIDALLGAAALGDIGKMFPDSDPGYKGADSMELLKLAAKRVFSRGYALSNLDCTIIAERPRLQPYIQDMVENIADCLKVPAALVNVKATTEEGMGFSGRGEGIAAHVVALILGMD
jgi:2-C-methyl-D-erythritol 2,4-cyclodiphosphate synthase